MAPRRRRWASTSRTSAAGSRTSAASPSTRTIAAASSRTTRRASSSATCCVDLDFHRLQLEIYGFNERAIQHAERSGFVREGVKRKAYWRHGEWADGVQFGLVREDLED